MSVRSLMRLADASAAAPRLRTRRKNIRVMAGPGLKGPKLLVELGEPAALLRVGERALAEELDARVGDVAGLDGVVAGDVVGAHEAVQDDVLGLAGEGH